ncbi:MAG TPA: hypothetical protein VGB81_03370 [Devosia sp.]|jgi:hypothetical protein
MAYTQAQYDALQSAIASGALTVEYGDKKVTYRSLTEMRAILSEMERDLQIGTRSRRVVSTFTKGLQ